MSRFPERVLLRGGSVHSPTHPFATVMPACVQTVVSGALVFDAEEPS
ncbi:MAG: hypothetical protein M3O94_07825 [Actinomycetota bacterium]|nr:hypothetical protein [Actinomycetota bacterium]